MFSRKPAANIDALESTIAKLESDMLGVDGDSDEYATMLNRLERLHKLKEKHSPKRVDPNTWLIVGGNLAGIIIVVGYERAHVIGSKAINMAGKLH